MQCKDVKLQPLMTCIIRMTVCFMEILLLLILPKYTNLGLGITTGTSVLIFTRLEGREPDSEAGRKTHSMTFIFFQGLAVVMENGIGFKATESYTHLEWSSVFHLYEQKMHQALGSLYLFRPSPQQKPAQTSQSPQTALMVVQRQQEASLSSSSQADSF